MNKRRGLYILCSIYIVAGGFNEVKVNEPYNPTEQLIKEYYL